MPRLLEALGRQLRFAAGEYWEIDPAIDALRQGMTWRATDVVIPEFEAASRDRLFKRGEGIPGRVWATGRWVAIPDLGADPDFPRREFAARDRLRSAAAFPLGGAGVLAFFRREEEVHEREIEGAAGLLAAQTEEFLLRVSAQEAARTSEARRAAILEAALDSIVSMDAKGLVTDWNPAAERMFGWLRGEALGRELAELIIPPRLRNAHRGGLARYLLTRQSRLLNQRVELIGMRKDGGEFPVELTITRIPIGGPPAFTGYLRDLTARRRADAEAREREAFRERFIGILGHDLRTPLQGILLSAQLLESRLSSQEDQRALGRVVSSAKRMSRMIDEVLDLTRGRLGGGIPVEPRPMDLAQTCQQALEETKAAWPARNILLEIQGDVTGQWDPDRLAQLLSNLIVNALVHGAPDRPVLVAAAAKGEKVALEVHNEGTPIPGADRDLIFDPFRIGAGSSPTGLGLGLYIAREIARAHGGDLEVESTAEQGTTFRTVLPRSR